MPNSKVTRDVTHPMPKDPYPKSNNMAQNQNQNRTLTHEHQHSGTGGVLLKPSPQALPHTVLCVSQGKWLMQHVIRWRGATDMRRDTHSKCNHCRVQRTLARPHSVRPNTNTTLIPCSQPCCRGSNQSRQQQRARTAGQQGGTHLHGHQHVLTGRQQSALCCRLQTQAPAGTGCGELM